MQDRKLSNSIPDRFRSVFCQQLGDGILWFGEEQWEMLCGYLDYLSEGGIRMEFDVASCKQGPRIALLTPYNARCPVPENYQNRLEKCFCKPVEPHENREKGHAGRGQEPIWEMSV